jgi:hypothetical protein
MLQQVGTCAEYQSVELVAPVGWKPVAIYGTQSAYCLVASCRFRM